MRVDLEIIKSIFDLTDEELMEMFKGFDTPIKIDKRGVPRFYIYIEKITDAIMFEDGFLTLIIKQSCNS